MSGSGASGDASEALRSLSDEQRVAVQTYSAVAASQSTNEAIRALTAADWNVQEAVERYLNQEETAVTLPASVRVTPPRRTHWILAALLSPLRVLWAVVRRVNGYLARLFGGHARALADAPGRAWERFCTVYESRHGRSHPPFHNGGLLDALSVAQADARFVVVYLHAESHSATQRFCARVMSDEAFIRAASQRDVVFWAADITQRDGAAAQSALRVGGFPYLALVQPPSRTVRSRGALPALTAANFGRVLASRAGEHAANMSGDGAAAWLAAAIDTHRALLERVRETRASRERNRRLIAEQNAEYQESLRADRERERLEREAREAVQNAERLEEEREIRRRRKKDSLGEEPDKAPGICSVVLRLPNGTRVSRRFSKEEALERVFDWAEVNLVDIEVACLVTTYPRKRFRYPEDAGISLQSAGLFPSAMLLLEEREEGE